MTGPDEDVWQTVCFHCARVAMIKVDNIIKEKLHHTTVKSVIMDFVGKEKESFGQTLQSPLLRAHISRLLGFEPAKRPDEKSDNCLDLFILKT